MGAFPYLNAEKRKKLELLSYKLHKRRSKYKDGNKIRNLGKEYVSTLHLK